MGTARNFCAAGALSSLQTVEFSSDKGCFHIQQRMAVMGGDDIVVGNKSAVRKSSQTIVGPLNVPARAFRARSDQAAPKIDPKIHPRIDRPVICGEMSQQRGHSGAQSTPQKFLQLVGYRDPNAGPPVKR
jgi:hypothetical protein